MLPFILLLFFPIIYVDAQELNYPEIIIQNNVNKITLKISPYLNLTQLIISNTNIQFNSYWFNLTHSGGIVNSNLTIWDLITLKRITFIIQNASLTNTFLWINSTKPNHVYLNTIEHLENNGWNYSSGICKVEAYNNINITLLWTPITPLPTDIIQSSGIDTGLIAVLCMIPLIIALLFLIGSKYRRF